MNKRNTNYNRQFNSNNYRNEQTRVEQEIDKTPIVEEFEAEPIIEEISVLTKARDGFVKGCAKLNVRFKATIDSDVLCILNEGDEVVVDHDNSTNEFYNVYLTSGIEGFVMRKFIELKF